MSSRWLTDAVRRSAAAVIWHLSSSSLTTCSSGSQRSAPHCILKYGWICCVKEVMFVLASRGQSRFSFLSSIVSHSSIYLKWLVFLVRGLEYKFSPFLYIYFFYKQSKLQLTLTASGNYAALLYKKRVFDILMMTSFVKIKILISAAKCHSILDKHFYTYTNHAYLLMIIFLLIVWRCIQIHFTQKCAPLNMHDAFVLFRA